jgi:hypothetical protein
MRSGVIAKGGSLLTERPLAMRERSLSGSGWKVRSDWDNPGKDALQLPPGDAEHFSFSKTILNKLFSSLSKTV